MLEHGHKWRKQKNIEKGFLNLIKNIINYMIIILKGKNTQGRFVSFAGKMLQ